MAYLIERKSQTIFVTGTSIIARGKPREMVIESRPEYAVVQLSGLPEKFPVPWEEVYAAAKKRHEANLRLEINPNAPSLHAIKSDCYHAKGMEKQSAQEFIEMLRFGGDPGKAAAQRSFEKDGFKGLVRWQIATMKADGHAA